MGRLWMITIILLLGMTSIPLDKGRVLALRDSLFDYVSFNDAAEWTDVYFYVCQEDRRDNFREPRLIEKSEDLRAVEEAKTPIAINTNDLYPTKFKQSLQIFNNPGIRNGYSVSYGFQRDKECLHGQDPDCVVSPDFGRVRAVVLNADRFEEGQNINFIKDHYLIEPPEKFVTILNPENLRESKFYEAVFLGGYNPQPVKNHLRGSHKIDGKSYPLEIYMYFVDESVPSISLSTILVVLVEESENDNPQIKPIISTINDKLYDEERRFIQNNRLLSTQERLFHHMEPSLNYGILKKEVFRGKETKEIVMDTSPTSSELESQLALLLDTLESLQYLETELNQIDEDTENGIDTTLEIETLAREFWERNKASPYTLFPYEFEELHRLAHAIISLVIPNEITKSYNLTYCSEEYFNHYTDNGPNFYLNPNVKPPHPYERGNFSDQDSPSIPISTDSTQHTRHYKFLFLRVCNFFGRRLNWTKWNEDEEKMLNITVNQKYARIKDFAKLLEQQAQLNNLTYSHFFDGRYHNEKTGISPRVQPKFKADQDPNSWVTTVVDLEENLVKLERFRGIKKTLEEKIEELAIFEGFESTKQMRESVRHLKYGEKNLKKRRDILHDAFYKSFLPHDKKRRGFEELGGMKISEESIDEMKTKSPVKVKVNQGFQVSWLIPKSGGYWHYYGSSPIPPCFRARTVIVFKQPIKMSRFQIETLTRVPTSFNRKHDINITSPFLHNTFFTVDLRAKPDSPYRNEEVKIEVYDEPRNHLFLGHDGFHINSVEQFEERKKLFKLSGTNSLGQLAFLWKVLTPLTYITYRL